MLTFMGSCSQAQKIAFPICVSGAKVELKCHVECWELGWGVGGMYANS
jgi:hypothetical protein